MAINAVFITVNSIVLILAVCFYNQTAAKVGNIVAFGSDRLPALFIAMGSVNKLYLPCTIGRLVLG